MKLIPTGFESRALRAVLNCIVEERLEMQQVNQCIVLNNNLLKVEGINLLYSYLYLIMTTVNENLCRAEFVPHALRFFEHAT